MCAQNEFDGTAPLTTVLFISPLCFKTDYLLLINAFFAAGSAIYYKTLTTFISSDFDTLIQLKKHRQDINDEILDTVEDCMIWIQIWQTTVTRRLE